MPDPRIGLGQQRPHRIDDLGAMRIDEQAVRLDVMPGDMDVAGTLERQGMQEGMRIEAEIAAVHVDVVHVEMQQAVSLADNAGNEIGFAHLGTRWREIVRGVLDADPAPEQILRPGDPVDRPFDGFFGQRYRQQFVEMTAGGTPGQMLGIEADVVFRHEGLDALQERRIERIRPAQRE